MRYAKLLSLGAAMALLVGACGGGPTVEAAGSPLGSPIAVHGDWTIEVYNADGTLDQRQEFKNEFLGSVPLARVLARESVLAVYSVRIGLAAGDPSSSWPCLDPNGEPFTCFIDEPGTPGAESFRSKNLQVVAGGPDGGQLILSGSVVAARDAAISGIGSVVYICSATCQQSPIEFHVFTRRTLEGPDIVQVLEGQLIQVEVIISFTSG